MAMRPPRICGCGKKVPGGITCECVRARQRAREAKRPSARERGYTSKWDAAKKDFLALPGNDKCRYCGAPATLVDHIVAHKNDKKLMWDRKNWAACCRSCNAKKSARFEGGYGNPIREFDGDL